VPGKTSHHQEVTTFYYFVLEQFKQAFFKTKFFSLPTFILAGKISPYEKTMKDKFLCSLKLFIGLLVLLFTWRKQDNPFALQQGLNHHFF